MTSEPDSLTVAALREAIGTPEAAAAFDLLVEGLAAMGLTVQPHEKGFVDTLRVERDGEWCLALNPAESWVLAYIRKPELRRGRLSVPDLLAAFPEARVSKAGEVLLRIHDPATATRWLDLLRAAG